MVLSIYFVSESFIASATRARSPRHRARCRSGWPSAEPEATAPRAMATGHGRPHARARVPRRMPPLARRMRWRPHCTRSCADTWFAGCWAGGHLHAWLRRDAARPRRRLFGENGIKAALFVGSSVCFYVLLFDLLGMLRIWRRPPAVVGTGVDTQFRALRVSIFTTWHSPRHVGPRPSRMLIDEASEHVGYARATSSPSTCCSSSTPRR